MTREHLIQLVERIIATEGTDDEIEANIDLFCDSVPHPQADGLIFWPDREMTPAEIVDRALAYVPAALPAPVTNNNV